MTPPPRTAMSTPVHAMTEAIPGPGRCGLFMAPILPETWQVFARAALMVYTRGLSYRRPVRSSAARIFPPAVVLVQERCHRRGDDRTEDVLGILQGRWNGDRREDQGPDSGRERSPRHRRARRPDDC